MFVRLFKIKIHIRGQAVDAPVEKCDLTKNNEETFYE